MQNVGATIETGINDSVGTIKTGVLDGVTKIESSSKTIINQIETILREFLEEVERVTRDVVINKIVSFFTQIGDILNNAIVIPFKTLFEGLGSIFFSIFQILKKLADKIVGLPKCFPAYGLNAIIVTFNTMFNYGFTYVIKIISGMLSRLLPSFIMGFLRTLYNYITIVFNFVYSYTLGAIYKVVMKATGIDAWIQKCVSFDVDEQVDDMNNVFRNIANTFRHNFGNIPALRL
jgi:hypothetical protein